MGDADKWDKKYLSNPSQEAQPARVLRENQYLLPKQGRALDLACGRGANALLLAQHGLETHSWDISEVVIAQLKKKQTDLNLMLHPLQRDVVDSPPESDSFDVIVVSRFLERKIIPELISALRSNGLIFYQTFIQNKVSSAGPKNLDYLLASNELLNLFSSLNIVFYREEGTIGNIEHGFRNEAMLIAQKH